MATIVDDIAINNRETLAIDEDQRVALFTIVKARFAHIKIVGIAIFLVCCFNNSLLQIFVTHLD